MPPFIIVCSVCVCVCVLSLLTWLLKRCVYSMEASTQQVFNFRFYCNSLVTNLAKLRTLQLAHD